MWYWNSVDEKRYKLDCAFRFTEAKKKEKKIISVKIILKNFSRVKAV